MGVLTDLIIQQTDLILRLARHINNTEELSPTAWGVAGMDLLVEVRQKYPEDYEAQVLKKLKTSKKKESTYVHQKERQAKEYVREGEYVNDKRNWTPGQLDDLLDHFLNGHPMLASNENPSLVNLCKRPVKAIQKALWRLGVRDPGRSRFKEYQPQDQRPFRHGAANSRDLYMIYLATSETGLNNLGGGAVFHLKRVLNRSSDETFDILQDLYKQAMRKPSLRAAASFHHRDKTQLAAIHTYLKKKLRHQIQEFSDE